MANVKLPNGKIAKFPEGTSPEEMQRVVSAQFGNNESQTQLQEMQPQKELRGAGGSFEESMTWVDTLKNAALNIKPSAIEYGKGIYESVKHPVETGKAILSLANELRIYQDISSIDKEQNIDKIKQIGEFMWQRYGSMDRFKETLASDPVGTLGDISSVVMPAGKIAGLSKLTKLGAALEPMSIPLKAAALPFKLIPEKVPINLYQSAVKFGTTLSAKQRLAVTKTALDVAHQIMPTNKGMTKLRGLIDNYNTKITNLINDSSQKGHYVHIDEIYQGIDELKDKFKRISDEPLKWEAAYSQLKRQWKESIKLDEMRSPQEIQKIKQRIYKDLESFYEKQKASPARVELRKGIARNSRKVLEDIIPEIKTLNRKEGALIELWDAIESKANRITNRDLIGIGLPVKMGTGAGVGFMLAGETGGSVGTALGFMLGIFDTPQVKAKMALVLNKLKVNGIKVRPTTAAIKLGLFHINREEQR